MKRVAAQKPNYDLVMLDAFDADYIPEHMLTQEFLEEVKGAMAPRGVIAANTFSERALRPRIRDLSHGVRPFFNLKLANRIILGRWAGFRRWIRCARTRKWWKRS